MVSDFNPQDSYNFFLDEATELLQVLEEGLFNIYTSDFIDNIYNLMRIAHSIKGGSALVGLNKIEQIAHHLESIFKLFYETKITIDNNLENLLLEAYDCLRSPLLSEINIHQSEGEQELLRIEELYISIKNEVEKKLLLNKEQNIKEVNNNYNSNLFANEIKQGLNRLEIILRQPFAPETKNALEAQLKILLGLAELAEISSLYSLINQTIQTIKEKPELIIFTVTNTLNQANNLFSNSLKRLNEQENISTFEQTDSTSYYFNLENSINEKYNSNINNYEDKLLPIGSRLDLIALNNISNLFNELVITDNNNYSNYLKQTESIQALQKWLSKITSKLSNQYHDNHISSKDYHSNDIHEYLLYIKETFQDLEIFNRQLFKEHENKQKVLRQINHQLLKAQMLPIGYLLKQFPRLTKELGKKQNKNINLTIEGQDILIGKLIIDKLYKPLIHLLRNAIYHGIESSEIRQKKGKTNEGNIQINVYKNNYKIIIDISDDGQGININKIKETILAKKLLSITQLNEISLTQLYQYLFESDFSTADTINNLSGRGMGLSIVQKEIRLLKGEVKIDSNYNLGTKFTLEIPLSLSLIELLVFTLNGMKIAIAISDIKSIISVDQTQIKTNEEGEYYQDQENIIPIFPSQLFFVYRYPHRKTIITSNLNQNNSQIRFSLLLISYQNKTIAIKCDRIITKQELVVKPLNSLIQYPAYLSSFTFLRTGEIVTVLDTREIINQYQINTNIKQSQSILPQQATQSPTSPRKISTVLIIDDSLTMRKSLSSTLQKNGYEVIQAENGWEALTYLEQYSNIKAVICDIEMPKMNGLEFLSHCRYCEYQELPIVILTSRNSEKYRQLAFKLGANEYITKPYLDRDLLNIIQQFS